MVQQHFSHVLKAIWYVKAMDIGFILAYIAYERNPIANTGLIYSYQTNKTIIYHNKEECNQYVRNYFRKICKENKYF